jgi:hypothetical protein
MEALVYCINENWVVKHEVLIKPVTVGEKGRDFVYSAIDHFYCHFLYYLPPPFIGSFMDPCAYSLKWYLE